MQSYQTVTAGLALVVCLTISTRAGGQATSASHFVEHRPAAARPVHWHPSRLFALRAVKTPTARRPIVMHASTRATTVGSVPARALARPMVRHGHCGRLGGCPESCSCQGTAEPLGAAVQAHFQTQILNGQRARLVLYHYDFQIDPAADNAELSQAGAKLARLLPILDATGFPLVVEPTPADWQVAEARRQHVLEYASSALGRGLSDSQVVVQSVPAEGLRAVEAAVIERNRLQTTRMQGITSSGFNSSGLSSGGANTGGLRSSGTGASGLGGR